MSDPLPPSRPTLRAVLKMLAALVDPGSWELSVDEEQVPGQPSVRVAALYPRRLREPRPAAGDPMPLPPPPAGAVPLPLVTADPAPSRRGGRPPEVMAHVLAFLLRGGQHHYTDIIEAMRAKGHSPSAVSENLQKLFEQNLIRHDPLTKLYSVVAVLRSDEPESTGGG